MSYKNKLEASAQEAHHQNIATKILRDLTELRSGAEDSPTMSRRWVWELIQNAKDVSFDDGVDIIINLFNRNGKYYLEFKHNGRPFTANNIRYLIEQISTKDRKKGEEGIRKETGKFGTGFLTTHLLSEIVNIKSVAKEEGLSYKQFELRLDRSGQEVDDIIGAVIKSKQSINNLDQLPEYISFNASDFNTTFTFELDDLGLKVAKDGIADLLRCLPYTLLFVDKIKEVEITHLGQRIFKTIRKNPATDLLVKFNTVLIEHFHENYIEERNFTTTYKDFTQIAIPINIENSKVEILSIENGIPTLFCDFPLIGTEVLPFPAIINCPNFNPTDPRDGVFLNNTSKQDSKIIENKSIIDNSIELHATLLEYAISNKWNNLHFLAKINDLKEGIKWLNHIWFNENVVKKIRHNLSHSKIVRTANGGLESIFDDKNNAFMIFPAANNKEMRDKIWSAAYFVFPNQLPAREDVELWQKLIWPGCYRLTLDNLANFVEHFEGIDLLSKRLNGITLENWFNEFLRLLQIDEKEGLSIFERRAIVPNQNGNFSKKTLLSSEKGSIDEELKDILELLGQGIRSKLLYPGINIDLSNRSIDISFVVKEIISEVQKKVSQRDQSQRTREAFNKLLLYFRDKPTESEAMFYSIYSNKHQLYDEEQIMININKAEKFDQILQNYNVASPEALKELIESKIPQKKLLPITEEIIASMGIKSVEEWTKALQDPVLKEMFEHNSVPTLDMFVYAQTHILKAKENVIAFLNKQPEYNLTNMDDQTATTILAGILKNGQPISIVFRPAYKKEVIIYYGSERDVLAYEPSELWVDDGKNIRLITLGNLLNWTGIKKFQILD